MIPRKVVTQNTTPFYGGQIIIDFLHDGKQFSSNASGLQEKWNTANPDNPCLMIDGFDFLTQPLNLKLPQTDNLRIYIVSHAEMAKNFDVDPRYLKSFNDALIKSSTLATKLADYIKDKNVIVNLAVCRAAEEDINNNSQAKSFAAQLHAHLSKIKKRDIPVVARVYLVAVDNSPKRKLTLKSTVSPKKEDDLHEKRKMLPRNSTERAKINEEHRKLWAHHQYGSKVAFTLDENNSQISLDGYEFLWKNRVFKILNGLIAATSDLAKLNILNDWKSSFSTKTNDEISQVMENELTKSDSVLKKSDNLLFSLFGIKPDTHTKIVDLIQERKQRLLSPDSISTKKTGNII